MSPMTTREGGAPLHARRQGEEDIQGHVDGAFESEDDLGGGVTDEQHVHAGAGEPLRSRGVVAGQAGEGPAILRHPAEGLDRDTVRGGHGTIVFGPARPRVAAQYDAGMPRIVTSEHMDDPNAPRGELQVTLRHLARLNRWVGGEAALLGHLRRWSRRWPRDRPVTLLDVGTGGADLPLAARAWAAGRGFDLRVTGIDVHQTTLALAQERVSGVQGVTLKRCDAKEIKRRFGAASFDYVHAGLLLHHLPDIGVLTVLAAMDQVARAGIIWNDLNRSWVAAAGGRLLTLGAPAHVKHDAIVSVRAAFTKREVLDTAARLGLSYCRYRSSPLTQRFTLAGEQPGAWA